MRELYINKNYSYFDLACRNATTQAFGFIKTCISMLSANNLHDCSIYTKKNKPTRNYGLFYYLEQEHIYTFMQDCIPFPHHHLAVQEEADYSLHFFKIPCIGYMNMIQLFLGPRVHFERSFLYGKIINL